MAFTIVQICNLALNEIGQVPIASIDDADNKNARNCKLLYEPTKNKLISTYKWNFAMARKTLAQLASTPAFGYLYQYQLPSDCLRAWEVYGSNSKWIIEGDALLCDDVSINLRYIKKIDDPNLFTTIFVDCLVLDLSFLLAIPITNDRALQELLLERFRISILDAFALNAIEGHLEADDELEDTSWVKEGRVG